MARRLLVAGHDLTVTTRTRVKAEPLLDAGANWADTPAGVSTHADVVFTIVGYPRDVEDVYFGEDGLVQNLRQGRILVDMTTSSPALARRIDLACRDVGAAALDAPVSGGDIGAREGRLSIMVGGSEEAFETVRPLFDLLGGNVVHQGAAGAGQQTKLCNQIVIAGTMIGVVEAMVFARRGGLDPRRMLDSIGNGAAASWALAHLAPRMLDGDLAPGFYVKHFIKDMTLALEAAEAEGLDLPGLQLVRDRYQALADQGGGDLGTQGLIDLYPH